ncbi:MAG: serine/threonine protein kinase [Deltaproteobacteria bacterium]|nr:serine/threonine protein kinase [Deltaproteobacteria bacterium]
MMAPLRPGDALDPALQIVRHLASGGMGEVYLADDATLGRRVAVKLLRPSAAADATAPTLRAAHEGAATARVVHPNAAAVYRVGRAHGRPMLVMEWVDGPTLRERLQQGPMPGAEAAARFAEIAAVVAWAHAVGLAHCDLKPENVLLGRDHRGREVAKVIDFGLARGGALPLGHAAVRHGTRAYLPPEAEDAGLGPLDVFAMDTWALAVLGCELFAGARPQREADGRSVLPTGMPAQLATALSRGLERVPKRRLRDPRRLAEAVAAACGAPVAGITASGAEPRSAAASRTSAAVATLQDQVQACYALLERPGQGLLQAAFGPGVDAVLGSLRTEGWLAEDGRPAAHVLAVLAADRLGASALSEVASRLADARIARPDRHGGDEDVARLLLAAGRFEDAAARVAAAARACASLRDRDRGLLRAATLLEAQALGPARVALQLERAELATFAGWLDQGRAGALAARTALSQQAAAAWPEAGVLRHRAALLLARLRLLDGDLLGAAARADALVEAAGADGAAGAALALTAAALALSARAQAGQPAAELEGALAALLARAASAAALGPDARAAIERARAHVAVALGNPEAAERALHRAAAAALDAGDAPLAAELRLENATLALARGAARTTEAAIADAAALLDGQGLIRPTLRLDLLEAELAITRGEPLAAMRRAAVALSRAEALGGRADVRDAATALLACCREVGDDAGAWHAEVRLRRLR